MNFVDSIIILIIFLGYFIGRKRGFLTELVSVVFFFLIMVGSFLLKNPVSQILYEKLPFFSFMGVFRGVTILNIVLYEIIAFILALTVGFIIFQIILSLSKGIQKIITRVPIFEIPSRLFGGLLGIVENYIIVFLLLYILTLPFFNFDVLNGSKARIFVLTKTPILSDYLNQTVDASNEIFGLKEKYANTKKYSSKEFNQEALDVLLKYKVTTVENIDKLVELKKLKKEDVESVLTKYRE